MYAFRTSRPASRSSTLLALAWAFLLPIAASAQEETKQPTEEPQASPVAPERDIYAVPEGTPEELLTYIEELLSTEPADRSPEGVQRHRDRLIESALAAATKVMEASEATPDQASRAAEIKLQLLTITARAGIEGMAEKLEEFKETLRKDERTGVRAVIVQRDLLQESTQWPKLDAAARDKLVAGFVSLLESIELERQHGQLVHVAAQIIGQHDKEAAAGLINKTAAIFKASADPDVAAVASRLEGLIRYMNLVGSEMEVEGDLLGGSPFDWSQYKGQVVLVDFWATWCGPCIAELPNVVRNYEQYHGKGFEVVGISLDTDRERVRRFVEENDVKWPILFNERPEEARWEHPMAVKYGIEAIPAPILVGKDGKVVSKEAYGDELKKHLQELLGEPLPASADAKKDPPRARQDRPADRK